ncbi:MAG: glycosyl hydrolase family 28-related protein, partial [Christensenella sp.]
MTNFSISKSLYTFAPNDTAAIILDIDSAPLVNGKRDITDILQETLDTVKTSDGYGIVLLPEGEYTVSKTIYVPRAVRLFGFGEARPVVTLPQNTLGFDKGEAGYHDDMKYMFWFTGNVPARDNVIVDANPGTFYSAIANIDFVIENGNPCAVAIRAHFAQNCYVSYCRFDIGTAKAGIDAVGNEMENLYFDGGEYGIYTGKCSPGWPFVLTDTDFANQRKASMCVHQSGITLRRVSFA